MPFFTFSFPNEDENNWKYNKGEWGEPYVAIKLLGDGKVCLSDHNGNKREDDWIHILEVIRHEVEAKGDIPERKVKYTRENDDISIYVNENFSLMMPISDFLDMSNKLKLDILNGSGKNFKVSDEVYHFLKCIEVQKVKADSKSKNDIYLTIYNPESGIEQKEKGFSIKNKMGDDPTIFNTGKASALVYKVNGMTDELMEEINNMRNAQGHVSVKDRCRKMIAEGCTLEFIDFPIATRARERACRENFDTINPNLVYVIEYILYDHFVNGNPRKMISELIDNIIQCNPCNLSHPEYKYPYMVKNFLYASYCAMTASTVWNGISEVNGGYIMVDPEGDILVNLALDSEEFKSYLYNFCYMEYPGTSKKHGYYGTVYKSCGEYHFKLNFQIRCS